MDLKVRHSQSLIKGISKSLKKTSSYGERDMGLFKTVVNRCIIIKIVCLNQEIFAFFFKVIAIELVYASKKATTSTNTHFTTNLIRG